MNTRKIIHLNCEETFEDMIDRSQLCTQLEQKLKPEKKKKH